MTDNSQKKQRSTKSVFNLQETCQLLIQAAADYEMVMLDSKGYILSWNLGAERLKGYKENEVVGKHFSIFFMPRDIAKRQPQKELRIAKKLGKFHGEGWRLRNDGTKFWAYVTINSIVDHQGKLLGFAKITQDLTERKKSEEILLAKNEELRHANALALEAYHAKSAFLSAMSHEIRTALNGIIILTDLLFSSDLTSEQLEEVKLMQTSENQLLAIINEILDYSKIDANKNELNYKDFNLNHLTENIIKFVDVAARQKKLKLITHIDSDVPQCVRGDPLKLRQVLNNLFSNALKFTQKGRITFNIKNTHATYPLNSKKIPPLILLFEVIDTGIGISKTMQKELFQPFSQGNPAIVRKYGGSGLGLTISKKLIELMGGIFEVKSELKKGCRFSFTLPFEVCKAKIKPQKKAIKITPTDKTLKNHILLVEDNKINQKVLLKFLEKLGYQVDIVNNGLKALNLAKKIPYHLILMDCQMPKMDGYKATQLIRQYELDKGKHTTIIAMTAHALKDDKEKCLTAGMDDYIAKPINIKKLEQMLNYWLSKKGEAYATPSLIDMQRIHEAFGNDSNTIKKFICSFLSDTEKLLAKIKGAIKSKKSQKLLEYFHKLKGSTSNLGIMKMSEISERAMENIKASNWNGMNENYQELIHNLKQIRKEAKSKYNC